MNKRSVYTIHEYYERALNKADRALRQLKGLYVITDPKYYNTPKQLLQLVEPVLKAGVALVQYRHKTASAEQRFLEAKSLQTLCQSYNTSLIINDDLDLAEQLGTGVHLGRLDMSITTARRRLGTTALVGVSCYDSLSLAQQAVSLGASYIAFGCCYPSTTKPDANLLDFSVFDQAKAQNWSTPIVAIGGIQLEHCVGLRHRGADMVAVIGSVWSATNIFAVCNQFQQQFEVR